jgi:peptidoglycan/LPS O-acetylase OafA/YrhL
MALLTRPEHRSALTPSIGPAPRPAHMPALDGLRGLAVAAVIGIHATWLPGGSIGVDVFFTLSGFLITLLLLREHKATGRIALGDFFRRRARRLLPALALLLVAFGWFVALVRPDLWTGLGIPLLLGATFNMDWGLLAFPVDRVGIPLEHLWSLGVEEKFYLLWAPLIVVLARTRWAAQSVACVAGLAAVLSAANAFSYAPEAMASYSRLYWSFDTRVQALLIGAAVAALFVAGTLERLSRRLLRVAAPLAAGGLVVVCVTGALGPYALASGGFTVVALCAGVLIAHIALTGGFAVLRWAPLRWLGRRSYAAYLWNFPLQAFVPNTLLWNLAAVAATLVAAELSWRLVEVHFVKRPSSDAGTATSRIDQPPVLAA